MGQPYSGDLRGRLIRAVAGGISARAAARLYEVGVATAVEWVRRWRDHGEVTARPMGGCRGTPLDGEAAWLLALVAEQSDLTLEEIRQRLADRGTKVSLATVWRFFERRKISYKKNRTRRRAGTARRKGGAGSMDAKPGIA